MSWRDQLQTASFQGLDFLVSGDDRLAGRRVQTHEYPRRNTPYSEDLGRSARRYRIRAYLIGPDYLDRLNGLLFALENSPSGLLIHPWYGVCHVVARGEGTGVTHFDQEGGMCRIAMDFVEAGKVNSPFSALDTASQLLSAANDLRGALSFAFALAG